ncbi:hypothetical protein llap_1249 [Limosa lapponica baueri]|uniref:Uncharacterized protein n=1 Tax=Limosa lapponica baueri TaxID=1758121 RepID=A0A2I0UR33_LIMLA|nr:hypothetical protein llap_1249 [Limosa lapponica baueri]
MSDCLGGGGDTRGPSPSPIAGQTATGTLVCGGLGVTRQGWVPQERWSQESVVAPSWWLLGGEDGRKDGGLPWGSPVERGHHRGGRRYERQIRVLHKVSRSITLSRRLKRDGACGRVPEGGRGIDACGGLPEGPLEDMSVLAGDPLTPPPPSTVSQGTCH